ncbi:hypothetical protein NDN08_004950 [Rhodosorus marinus]|uniref:Uncharacterized protein n=1 Tax=Rhodosorus marinus TaxID=101924 RepID=A0AAV8UF39_9RHOD|nr:hypothetical protein NDN08_004950 [Rhodosorus marinus]
MSCAGRLGGRRYGGRIGSLLSKGTKGSIRGSSGSTGATRLMRRALSRPASSFSQMVGKMERQGELGSMSGSLAKCAMAVAETKPNSPARRAGLAALAELCVEEDDDG